VRLEDRGTLGADLALDELHGHGRAVLELRVPLEQPVQHLAEVRPEQLNLWDLGVTALPALRGLAHPAVLDVEQGPQLRDLLFSR
jgi:hypothetical protein